MCTDMVGYTALATRDERLALELLEEYRQRVRTQLAAHSGREVKTIGDGFLIEFPSALAAANCAVAIQREFHERRSSQPRERDITLRVAIHLGDVVDRGG